MVVSWGPIGKGKLLFEFESKEGKPNILSTTLQAVQDFDRVLPLVV